MKILITTELYKGSINGVVTSIKNLENHLTKLGHEVRILTVSEKNRSYKEKNAYYIKSIPTRIYNNLRVPITIHHRFIDEIVRWKPDVIHSQSEFFTFVFAKSIKKSTGAVLVHTNHTFYEQYVDYLPMGTVIYTTFKPWLKLRLAVCDAIIAPTEKTLGILRSYGIENYVNVVPTGIDIAKFRTPKSEQEIIDKKKELGISLDKKILMVLSRLGHEKNISELLFGTCKLLEKNPNLIFLIVGDGPAKNDLMRLAKNLNIEDKVIFTGMVDPVNVPLYYQLADIFVSASTSETQGLTYIEAMASGLPLVCKKDDCLNELIVKGENGFAYEKIEDLEKYINVVLETLPGKNALSKKISEKFSVEKFTDDILKIYNKLRE